AGCSEVEIDTLTGDHTILRTDICMDIGRSLNYALDVGQIEGGFMQGVGWHTLEESSHFPNGAKVSNLNSIHGSKGIGEPPLLLGILRSPATPERIRIACDDEIVRNCKVEKKDGELPW
ncbi:1232_t:CDS:2, partial [Racocetra persica]